MEITHQIRSLAALIHVNAASAAGEQSISYELYMSPQPGLLFSLKIRVSFQISDAPELQKVKSSLKHPPKHFPLLFQ